MSEPAPAAIPIPAEGDFVRYRGSDGSLLEVRVGGQESTLDAYQMQQVGQHLEFRLRPAANTNVEIVYHEYVLSGSGAHLRQNVDCFFDADLDASNSEECDPRFRYVFKGAGGLPGGLGVAPLWGRPLPSAGSSFELSVDRIDVTQSLGFTATAGQGRCTTIQATTVPPLGFATTWMPGTVLRGPYLLCPDEWFPRAFVSHMKMPQPFSDQDYPVFTVEKSRQSADHRTIPWTTPPRTTAPRIETEAPSPLAMLSPHPIGQTNFSSLEAHEEAMRLDDEYQHFFRGRNDAFIVRTSLTTGGGGTRLAKLVDETFDEWYLMAMSSDESSVDTQIAKVVRTGPDGQRYTEYELRDPRQPPWTGAAPSNLTSTRLVDTARAFELAATTFELPPIGAIIRAETNDGGLWHFPRTATNGSFAASVHVRPPDSEGNIIQPWWMTMNAATGAATAWAVAPEMVDAV